MRRANQSANRGQRARTAIFGAALAVAGIAPSAGAISTDPAALSAAQMPSSQTTPATSYPVLELTGHGWGHGRGLSQYGALGYAQQGWSSSQILDHYYGGTTQGPVPAGHVSPSPTELRVDLRLNREYATRVDIQDGSIQVLNGAQVILTTPADSHQAIRISTTATGLSVETASSCSGEWTVVADVAAKSLDVIKTTSVDSSNGLLRVCEPSGSSTWYDGSLRTYSYGGSTGVAGTARTVNIVSVEQYLRGVVPKEVPSSWPSAALQAQSVAARSYVLAGDSRWHEDGTLYADTCDSTLCQVYKGRYQQNSSGFITTSADSTDAAIAATAGQVRITSTGTVARTEFSSSTGGYSAGGTFPAVVDEGDSVSTNSNHDWSVSKNLRDFEAQTGLGHLTGVEVTGRNGLGEDGGRVTSVLFTFTDGSLTKTGSQARSLMGLKSDWFSVISLTRVATDTAAARYINHVYGLFLGRGATDDELASWVSDVELGRRENLTTALALTDEWAGSMVDDFYQAVLGRAADAEGRAHWLGKIVGGVRVEAVGVRFYGSVEFFEQSGGTNEGFVAALYQELLGRQADTEGLASWVAALDQGRMSTEGVASGFYASIESRRSRVEGLYQQILLRSPDAEGREYWAGQLLHTDDVRLASQLAASGESFEIAQR